MLSVARGSLKRLVDFSGKENFLIMGNIVKKQVDDSEPTPELRSLTQEQVEIIQRTWYWNLMNFLEDFKFSLIVITGRFQMPGHWIRVKEFCSRF